MKLGKKRYTEMRMRSGKERWLFSMGYSGGELVDGNLLHDLGDDCVVRSAFEVFGEPRTRSVRFQFSLTHNFTAHDCITGSSICFDINHVSSAPEKVLMSMIEAGLNVCPEKTAAQFTFSIRTAVEFVTTDPSFAAQQAAQRSVAQEAHSFTLQ